MVKGTILLTGEYRRGAHFPSLSHWARRWIYHRVCDAWPTRRQTYGYLSECRAVPFCWYLLITYPLAEDRRL